MIGSGLLSRHPDSRPGSAEVLSVLGGLTEAGNTASWGTVAKWISSRRRTVASAALALFAAAVAFGVWACGDAPVAQPTVVAVLPFVNASGDAARDYLAAGLSDSLIPSLAALPPVTVLSRASIAEAGRRSTVPTEIARDLGATMLVEGTLQESEKVLKVSVALVRPEGTVEKGGVEVPLLHADGDVRTTSPVAFSTSVKAGSLHEW